MPTEETLDPSEETPAKEPPPSETAQPSEEEPTETVEGLKEKLAAAETEAKRWKGRVEKANEPKKTKVDPEDLAALEWRLENKDRIALVKDEWEKIKEDGYHGEKVSEKIALELAEKQAKVDDSGTKRNRQNDMTVPSVTTRNANPKGYASETDKALGLTIEKKKKLEERHPHLLEE